MGEMFSFHLKGCGEEGNQPLVMSYKSFVEKTGFRPLNGMSSPLEILLHIGGIQYDSLC